MEMITRNKNVNKNYFLKIIQKKNKIQKIIRLRKKIIN